MFAAPNVTCIPTEYVDSYMAKLHPSATAVFLAVCRREVTLLEICFLTGLVNNTAYRGIRELLRNELIRVVRGTNGDRIFAVNTECAFSKKQKAADSGPIAVSQTELVPSLAARAQGISSKKRDKTRVLSTRPDSQIYQKAWNWFLDQNDKKFSNYPKESRALHSLIGLAEARDAAHAKDVLASVCHAFWTLKTSDTTPRGFWRNTPCLPSALVPLWDRVLETIRRDEVSPEVAAIIKGAV